MTDYTDTEIDFTEALDFTDDLYVDDVALAMLEGDSAPDGEYDMDADIAEAWGF
jgi:hypothetical protein